MTHEMPFVPVTGQMIYQSDSLEKMSHARWLIIITANRILRLYVATFNPTTELKLTVRICYQSVCKSVILCKIKTIVHIWWSSCLADDGLDTLYKVSF